MSKYQSEVKSVTASTRHLCFGAVSGSKRAYVKPYFSKTFPEGFLMNDEDVANSIRFPHDAQLVVSHSLTSRCCAFDAGRAEQTMDNNIPYPSVVSVIDGFSIFSSSSSPCTVVQPHSTVSNLSFCHCSIMYTTPLPRALLPHHKMSGSYISRNNSLVEKNISSATLGKNRSKLNVAGSSSWCS